MVGQLKPNVFGAWEIVNNLGGREVLSDGDVIEVLNEVTWTTTTILLGGGGWYLADGSLLYTGKIARILRRPVSRLNDPKRNA